MQTYQDLAYVANGRSRQKLDLFIPDKGKKWPLIMWIHGGAFRTGSKKDNVPIAYSKHGFAVASLNYRLSQHAVFPAQIEDIKAAARWLRGNARKYRLDPGRFGVWGESSGGHLAALLGLTGNTNTFDVGEHLDISSQVQAVVDYFGPTDFLQMDKQRLPGGMVHDPPDSPESELIGGAIQMHKDLAAKANPITYVTGDAPPFLIVHGDHDPLVPYQQSVILNNALVADGVPVSFYTVMGEGHGYFKDPKVADITLRFFERHLKSVNVNNTLLHG
ncbi:MAG: alpha/beta hydrolase [Spirochaetales bacterium]|nr:alpha/beta hydrolase [Spirochaetales bacterium]